MQGMFRSNCSVQVGNCKKTHFLQISTVPQVSLHLASPKPLTGQFQHRLKQQNTTSICNRKRQIHGNMIILMMLGMQILRVRGKSPPPKDLGEMQISSTKDPQTLEQIQGFGHVAQHAQKIAVPKAFGFDKRFRRKTKLRTAMYTLDWRRWIYTGFDSKRDARFWLRWCRLAPLGSKNVQKTAQVYFLQWGRVPWRVPAQHAARLRRVRQPQDEC